MDDNVLTLTGRGHTAADTVSAVALLKRNGYTIGLQMMTGLPGDDEKRTCQTGRLVAGLEPEFVRIYPTVVLKNSILADWYQSGRYQPPSLIDSIAIVKRLLLFFRENNSLADSIHGADSEDATKKCLLRVCGTPKSVPDRTSLNPM